MVTIVERRPVAFTVGTAVVIVGLTVFARLVLAPLLPFLTLDGLGLLLNWVFVALVLGLVAWLGWWEKIRLTAPVNRGALVYLLPFVAMILLPFAFGLAIPEISLVEGETVPPLLTVAVVVVGVSLGAAISEELLYRGVLLRALESRGPLVAGILPAVLFGLTHVSKIVLGGPVAEWLPAMLFIIPTGIGLAAVTLRLGSLWPLVGWHFAVDSTNLLVASASAAYTLATIGLIALTGAMGLWLLWQDERAYRAANRDPDGTPVEPVSA
jgi:membrane protease YdiL (CAAX protease family)